MTPNKLERSNMITHIGLFSIGLLITSTMAQSHKIKVKSTITPRAPKIHQVLAQKTSQGTSLLFSVQFAIKNFETNRLKNAR